MRRILFAHPKICIPPETYVLHKCIQYFQVYNHLPWNILVNLVLATLEYHPKFTAFNLSLRPLAIELQNTPKNRRSLAFILDQFYRYYAREKELQCSLWGDKTPKNTYHLDKIHNVFPKARYIHMIRNGADVVHSYIKSGLRPELHRAAVEWQKTVKLAQSFGDLHPSQYIEIRYENLVQNPAQITRTICNFLGIQYFEGIEEQTKGIVSLMGDVQEFEHLSNVENQINTRSIGKGVKTFNEAQINELKNLIGSTMDELGYEL